jgi:hypothetical protein
MSKQEILVQCFFLDKGDDIRLILSRSFRLFLQQELENIGRKLASSGIPGV